MEWDRQNFLSFWAIFCPFSSLTTWRKKNFKNETNIWKYYNFTDLHHKWQSYDVWFLRYGVHQIEFFVILHHFLPFYPLPLPPSPMDPKNQNFGQMNNTLEDIVMLQMYTINDSHMMYGSWDMKCNRQNFLWFWTIFLPFYPPNNTKNQNFERVKQMPGDIIILDMCTINDNHMMYRSWDTKCYGQNFL